MLCKYFCKSRVSTGRCALEGLMLQSLCWTTVVQWEFSVFLRHPLLPWQLPFDIPSVQFFKPSSKSLLCKEWAEHTFFKKWAGWVFLAWVAHTRSISDFKFPFPFLGSSEGLCIAGKRSTSKPHLQPLYFQIFRLLLAATYNVPVILGDLYILSVIVTSIL